MGQVGYAAQVARRSAGKVSGASLTAAGWAVGLTTTTLIVGTPYLLFGYHSPQFHLVLDTIDACVALLLAFLVYGRFLRSGRLQHLLLAEGLSILAAAGLGLTLAIGLVPGFRPGTLDVWLPLTLRVVGSGMVAAAALAGGRIVARSALLRGQVLLWGLMAATCLALWVSRDGLPTALAASAPAATGRPFITGHPVLIVAQSMTALCFLVASVAFAAQASRRHDELLRWLGPACALAGFARVNYVLFPSLYSGWVYTGDLLRTASYLLLLVGAAREISHHWAAQSRAAVLEDRRRLARELHDGLLQEVAYLRLEAQAATADPAAGGRLVAACDRVRDEARSAVDALGWSPEEPLGFILHRAARQVADRYSARVDVDLDDSVDVDHQTGQALVRITREAVSNALRHGGARRICLVLKQDGPGNRLVVEDDGVGFDQSEPPSTDAYGLISMAERARGLGGAFSIDSVPGCGTKVVVTW